MGKYTYTSSQVTIENHLLVGDLERNLPPFLQGEELSVVLDSNLDRIKKHIFSTSGLLLEEVEEGSIPEGQSSGEGTSLVTVSLNPIEDVTSLFYTEGDVQILYQFLRDWYTPGENTQFYLESISSDRTEIRCYNPQLPSPLLLSRTGQLSTRIESEEFLPEVYVRFPGNNSFTILNTFSSVENGRTFVVFKLLTPLPLTFSAGTPFTVEEEIATPLAFEVQASYQEDVVEPVQLKGPNFQIGEFTSGFDSTPQFSYDDLLGESFTNSLYEVRSQVERQGMQLSIDFSDYSNFVHFSSAVERLKVFRHKLQTLERWEIQLEEAKTFLPVNILKYETFISNLLKNMDDYERYLYFESTPYSWPKSNTERPFQNYPSDSAIGVSWYDSQMEVAELFDEHNPHRLTLSIPRYLREDPANLPYLLFVDMIGNHFDNLWLYSKSFSQRYNTDHRLNKGLSRDLVRQAVESLGVKLFGASSNITSLFSFFTGEAYVSGSGNVNEHITEYVVAVSGSTAVNPQPIAQRDYQQEIYKRIYHNLPLLLKTKGTERSIRTLINCYGIPSDILKIRQYGGTSKEGSRYTGPMEPVDSSIDKIRVETLYEEEPGNTLSQYTSILSPTREISDDQPLVEVGFNPSLEVWEEVKQILGPEFNIDNYIGDPRLATEKKYAELDHLISQILPKLELEGLLRLLKFFDNSLFRIIQNFIPAKANLATGVILSSSPLQRSKHSQPQISFEQSLLEGEEEVGRIEGSHGESILGTTACTFLQETPVGDVSRTISDESPKYNGELQGSQITVLQDGELNSENEFKLFTTSSMNYNSDWNPTINNVVENRLSEKARIGLRTEILPRLVTGSIFFWYGDTPTIQTSSSYSPYEWSSHNGDLLLQLQWSGSEESYNTFVDSYGSYTGITVTYKNSGTSSKTLNLKTANKVEYLYPEINYTWHNIGDIPIVEGYEYYETVTELNYLLQEFGSDIEARLNTVFILESKTYEGKAQVQDQIYHDTGLNRSKHIGTKTSAKAVNSLENLTGSYGRNTPVAQTDAYLGYITNIEDPYPVINNSVYLKTKYLVDETGTLQEIKLGESTDRDFKEVFQQGKSAKISLTVPTHQKNLEVLNKLYPLSRVGKIYTPILYSQNSGNNFSSFIPFKSLNKIDSYSGIKINYTTNSTGSLNIPENYTSASFGVTGSYTSISGSYFIDGLVAPYSSSFYSGSLLTYSLLPQDTGSKDRYQVEYNLSFTTPGQCATLTEYESPMLDRTLAVQVLSMPHSGSSLPNREEASFERLGVSQINFQIFMKDALHPLHRRVIKIYENKVPLRDRNIETLYSNDVLLPYPGGRTLLELPESSIPGIWLDDSVYFDLFPDLPKQRPYANQLKMNLGVYEFRRHLAELINQQTGTPWVSSTSIAPPPLDLDFSKIDFFKFNVDIRLEYIAVKNTAYELRVKSTSRTTPSLAINITPEHPAIFKGRLTNVDSKLPAYSIQSKYWDFLRIDPELLGANEKIITFWQTETPPVDEEEVPLFSLWYNPSEELLYRLEGGFPDNYWSYLFTVDRDVIYYYNRLPYNWTGTTGILTGGKLEPAFQKIYLVPEISKELYGDDFQQSYIPYTPAESLRFPGQVEPQGVSIPTPTYPFRFQTGDEIRFENNEEKTFTIISIDENYYVPEVGERIVLTLNKAIPQTTNLNFFLVRRTVESKGNVVVQEVFPYTQTSTVFTDAPDTIGLLLPEHPSEGIGNNIQQITESLITKELR